MSDQQGETAGGASALDAPGDRGSTGGLDALFAGRFSSSTGVIGIDFGSRGIKMVQLRDKVGSLQVVGAARLDVSLAAVQAGQPFVAAPAVAGAAAVRAAASSAAPAASASPAPAPAEELAEQIRSAYVSAGFVGPRCIIGLAREDVCLQSIRLPRMPDDELRQAALWEASQRFGFDRNAMQVDFIRTGATASTGGSSAGATGAGAPAAENREEVILVAASHAAITARIEPVLAAGLRPMAIDTGFSAIVRAFSRHVRRESDRGHVRAIVEVGESGSTVLILRGDQVAFCKPIAIGGRNFNQAVADHLRISPQQAAELRESRIANRSESRGQPASADGRIEDPAADRAVYEAVRPLMGDLVKEVTLCLRYYGVTFRGHPPDHIILTGGDSLEPRLNEVMAQTCKTPVLFDDDSATLATLLPQIRTSLNRTPGPAAAWTVALGLSIRGIRKRAGTGATPARLEAGASGETRGAAAVATPSRSAAA